MMERQANLTTKRFFDLAVASIAFTLLSPILILTAIAVVCSGGFPVLFRQQRPGMNGQPFVMYKFRSMVDKRDDAGALLSDQRRLNSVGRFLRKTSLDELPELINVIKGEMSLVGPRPLLMEYLARYTPEQARRHHVKPGITGWAQVNGRNALSWEEKFELDVWYVDNRDFLLDLKILWLTLVKVFKQEGITAEEHVSMPEFMGTNEE